MKVNLVAFLLVLGAFISGCASKPYQSNDRYSEAMNIARAGGMNSGLRDAKVPQDQFQGMSDMMETAVDLNWIKWGADRPMLGMSSLQAAGLHLLGNMVEAKDHGARNSLIAWMPKDMASSGKEAQEILMAVIQQAVSETMVEMGGEASDPNPRRSTGITEMLNRSAYVGAQVLYNEEWSCHEQVRSYKEACTIAFRLHQPLDNDGASLTPDFFDEPGVVTHKFSAGHGRRYHTLIFNVPEEANLPQVEFLTTLSRNLPDWFYMYFAPGKVATEEGELLNFPFILHQGKVKLFVVPDQA